MATRFDKLLNHPTFEQAFAQAVLVIQLQTAAGTTTSDNLACDSDTNMEESLIDAFLPLVPGVQLNACGCWRVTSKQAAFDFVADRLKQAAMESSRPAKAQTKKGGTR